jgi:hypothetical protein
MSKTATKSTVIHECDNCGWEGTEDQLGCVLADMPDLYERLAPGCPCPSGECPECRACCYPDDENWRKLQAFPDLLDAAKAAYDCISGERLDGDDVMRQLREAIAKATGK